MASTRSIDSWNFYTDHVGRELSGANFISSSSILIAAGPQYLDSLSEERGSNEQALGTGGGNGLIFPIALVQNFNLAQNKQVQRLMEIGSYRSLFIDGRTINNCSLGTVLFNGPSLLRSLYAYYTLPEATNNESGIFPSESLANTYSYLAQGNEPTVEDSNIPFMKEAGSNELFWINLASWIFQQPIGILLYFKDNAQNSYGAVYLEDTHIDSHNVGITAGSTIIMENVSMQFDQVNPVIIGQAY